MSARTRDPADAVDATEPSSGSMLWRIAVAVGLLVIGVSIMLANSGFRDLEAEGASVITRWLTRTDTVYWQGHQVFMWSVGTSAARGLFITPDCSAAFVIGPLLGIAALVCVGRRLPPERVLFATAIAASAVAAVNIGRVSMIAWATHLWGPQSGFWWSHIVAGSIMTLAGGVLGLWILVRAGFRPARPAVARSGSVA